MEERTRRHPMSLREWRIDSRPNSRCETSVLPTGCVATAPLNTLRPTSWISHRTELWGLGHECARASRRDRFHALCTEKEIVFLRGSLSRRRIIHRTRLPTTRKPGLQSLSQRRGFTMRPPAIGLVRSVQALILTAACAGTSDAAT
jgi:hypothetical protein